MIELKKRIMFGRLTTLIIITTIFSIFEKLRNKEKIESKFYLSWYFVIGITIIQLVILYSLKCFAIVDESNFYIEIVLTVLILLR